MGNGRSPPLLSVFQQRLEALVATAIIMEFGWRCGEIEGRSGRTEKIQAAAAGPCGAENIEISEKNALIKTYLDKIGNTNETAEVMHLAKQRKGNHEQNKEDQVIRVIFV